MSRKALLLLAVIWLSGFITAIGMVLSFRLYQL